MVQSHPWIQLQPHTMTTHPSPWGVFITGRNEVVAKVIILQASVCPQVGGGSASVHVGIPASPKKEPPQDERPPKMRDPTPLPPRSESPPQIRDHQPPDQNPPYPRSETIPPNTVNAFLFS